MVASAWLVLRTKEIVPPDSFGLEPNHELKSNFSSEDVFTLTQTVGTYKALVFRLSKVNDADSDYRVVFYKKVGERYIRHGAEANLLNFERPLLSEGSTPRVETSMNELGVKYHFIIDTKGVEMVPTEGFRADGSVKGHSAP